MMQVIDTLVAMKYGDIGLSLIGGVLFLRLINPAVVLPQKHNILEPSEVTLSGQRGLLIVSKILQRLANQEQFDEEAEPHMLFANRFIRKNLPHWRSVFHKFMVIRHSQFFLIFQDWKRIAFCRYFSLQTYIA